MNLLRQLQDCLRLSRFHLEHINGPQQDGAGFDEAIGKALAIDPDSNPDNRLMNHLVAKCALTYACPAARNLCLGRYEAPLPVSRVCNARCIGCISQQEEGSKICATPQNRMAFTPTAKEITEVMLHHAGNEKDRPIYSFGQGCEGEPLTQAALITEAIAAFRARGGTGTVNINSNASMPETIPALAKAACYEAHTGYPVPRYLTQAGCEDLIRLVLPPAAAGKTAKDTEPRPASATPKVVRKTAAKAAAEKGAPPTAPTPTAAARKTPVRKPRAPKAST